MTAPAPKCAKCRHSYASHEWPDGRCRARADNDDERCECVEYEAQIVAPAPAPSKRCAGHFDEGSRYFKSGCNCAGPAIITDRRFAPAPAPSERCANPKCGHTKREHFNGTGPCDAINRDCGLDCHAYQPPAPAPAPGVVEIERVVRIDDGESK